MYYSYWMSNCLPPFGWVGNHWPPCFHRPRERTPATVPASYVAFPTVSCGGSRRSCQWSCQRHASVLGELPWWEHVSLEYHRHIHWIYTCNVFFTCTIPLVCSWHVCKYRHLYTYTCTYTDTYTFTYTYTYTHNRYVYVYVYVYLYIYIYIYIYVYIYTYIASNWLLFLAEYVAFVF